jgi:hypothetical protein
VCEVVLPDLAQLTARLERGQHRGRIGVLIGALEAPEIGPAEELHHVFVALALEFGRRLATERVPKPALLRLKAGELLGLPEPLVG